MKKKSILYFEQNPPQNIGSLLCSLMYFKIKMNLLLMQFTSALILEGAFKKQFIQKLEKEAQKPYFKNRFRMFYKRVFE